MKNSKVVSCNQLIFSGEHVSFINSVGKKMFKFTIEFENGDKGTMFSISNMPKYKTGDHVQYDIYPNKTGTGHTISGHSLYTPNSGGYNDPVKNTNIAHSMANFLAIKYVRFFGSKQYTEAELYDVVDKIEKYMFEWITLNVENNYNVYQKRWQSLEKALYFVDILKPASPRDMVFSVAAKFIGGNESEI